MIVRVPPIERKIPTPIKFQVERVASVGFELDAANVESGTLDELVAKLRQDQRAELDALEDAVRVAYNMPPRQHGYDKKRPIPTDDLPPIKDEAFHKIVKMRARDRVCSGGHRSVVYLSIREAVESTQRCDGVLLCRACQAERGVSQ